MGIVEYTSSRTFNVGQAIQDGWGLEWESEKALIGLELQDRANNKHTEVISAVNWLYGTIRVHFESGGWLCLDHAVEQFKNKI